MTNDDNIPSEAKYLVATEEDELWGLVVTTLGSQVISAEESYPPAGHPQGYSFDVDRGRVLNEYQLLYITDGEGIFTYGDQKESQLITEGKMFFLFPGVWHTYRPFANSGWKEYWIGFKGETIDRIVAEGFFVNQAPVFNIGLNERIVDLYIKAFDIAHEGRSGYQQALSGVVMHLLGLMYYRHRTRDFVDAEMINKMNKAMVIMRESVYENLSAKEVSERLHIGYSGFRKAFKEYTGTSPAQYMQELKLNEAKLLLTTTLRPVKEISYSLKYENPEYFSMFFKRRTAKTPLEYRNFGRAEHERPAPQSEEE